MRKVEILLAHEVDEPARCAHDDVDALVERLNLRFVGAATVEGEDPNAAALAGGLDIGADLDGELAGRDHDEGLRFAECRIGFGDIRVDGFECGDPEAEGLSRAGLGLANDVPALKSDREGHGLDREGSGDAFIGERGDDLLAHAEIGKDLVVSHVRGLLSVSPGNQRGAALRSSTRRS